MFINRQSPRDCAIAENTTQPNRGSRINKSYMIFIGRDISFGDKQWPRPTRPTSEHCQTVTKRPYGRRVDRQNIGRTRPCRPLSRIGLYCQCGVYSQLAWTKGYHMFIKIAANFMVNSVNKPGKTILIGLLCAICYFVPSILTHKRQHPSGNRDTWF